MTDLYMVAWTGGYEEPGFFFFHDRDAAMRKADECVADVGEPSDRIHVVCVGADLSYEVLGSYDITDKEKRLQDGQT